MIEEAKNISGRKRLTVLLADFEKLKQLVIAIRSLCVKEAETSFVDFENS